MKETNRVGDFSCFFCCVRYNSIFSGLNASVTSPQKGEYNIIKTHKHLFFFQREKNNKIFIERARIFTQEAHKQKVQKRIVIKMAFVFFNENSRGSDPGRRPLTSFSVCNGKNIQSSSLLTLFPVCNQDAYMQRKNRRGALFNRWKIFCCRLLVLLLTKFLLLSHL